MIGWEMPSQPSRKGRWSPVVMSWIIGAGVLMGGCPNDMREQPSYSSQELPRRHSPQGSIPHVNPFSHSSPPRESPEIKNDGAQLFAINCAHCHGPQGMGDGPVAGFLPDLPANLQASAVQRKTDGELFGIVTKGKDVMPAFELFLSDEERRNVVSFVRTLVGRTHSSLRVTQGEARRNSAS